MRVTMKEIAAKAGVSRGAVSAVLNNISGIRVSPQVREKILGIAAELNYRPDFAANALKRGRTGLLGFVSGGLTMPFFSELADSIMRESSSRGYQLVVMPVDWQRQSDIEYLERMLDIVDGVFMCSGLFGESDAGRILVERRRIPFVLMNDRTAGVASVSIDFAAGMDRAFEVLKGYGHSKIAFAGAADDIRKLEAYRYCCGKYGLAPEEYLYKPCGPIEDIIDCGAAIAGNRMKHTALVTSDYGMGIMIHGMDRMNLRIPDELSVMCFAGRQSPVRFFRPPLSSVDLDCEAMARCAADIMKSRLENPEMPPESIVLQPSCTMRQSVRSV